MEVYTSAEEYLERLKEGYDGFLVLDHKMGKMTGLELQEVLLRKNVKPSIIFITAMGDQVKEQALANGALRVFDKPFDLALLISLLDDMRKHIGGNERRKMQ